MALNDGWNVGALLGLDEPRLLRAVAFERHSLNPIGGVGLESVTLAASDGDEIPCLFLTPPTPTPKPWHRAVIAVHQHAGRFDLGKSELAGLRGDPSMAFGLRLAQSGFPTLIPDLVGFEERQRPGDDPASAERFDALIRIAEGSSLQAKHTSDVAVATSWLAENEDIPGPIGIMGHSLGGQIALFNLAFDNRLKAGVINCGIGTLTSFRDQRIPHNPAWFVPGLIERGDVQSIAANITDPQVLVVAGTVDPWFPASGVREVVDAFPPGACDFREERTAHKLSEGTLSGAVIWPQRNL